MSQKNTLFNYFVSPARKNNELGSPKTTPDTNKDTKTPKSKLKSPSTPRSNKVTPTSLSVNKKSSKVSEKAFEICDVVWSKLHGYPWWPSLVCNHPKLLKHIKGDSIHVQFFDDPPTRAWVKRAFIEPYKNSADKTAPNRDAAKWKNAASEADKALEMSVEARKKLIVAFSDQDGSEEDDASMDVDTDDEAVLNSSGSSANDADKENQEAPPLKKLLLDADDSEDDYKPVHDDLNDASDSASSGVNSADEAFSGEEPEDSPVKRKKKSKSDQAVKKQKLTSGKPVVVLPRPSLAKETVSKPIENKNEGFQNDWAHLKYEFLKPHKIRDGNRRSPEDPEYNARTVYVPEDFKKNLSPGMKQWWDIKAQNFDCVLFFKVGKFYELYHMDAVTGVNELGLIYMKGEFAHSGFPEISYARFSSALVEKGFKVARVEQTETPDMMAERLKGAFRATKFDKVVKREVCQITTKGTRTFSVIDGEAQEASSRYLLALIEKELDSNRSSYGVCFIDTSIGVFNIGQFSDDKFSSQLRMLIAHNPPVQVLYLKKSITDRTQQLLNSVLTNVLKEPLSKSEFWPADKTLMKLAEGDYFPKKETGGVGWPEGLKQFLSDADSVGLSPRDEYSLAVSALGAVIWYLQKCLLDHQLLAMGQFELYVPSSSSDSSKAPVKEIMPKHMILDGITLKNLDVLECPGGQEGALLYHLDCCSTKFGKRLLRQWICSPLCNIESIKSRQEAISDLRDNSSVVKEVREKLSQLPDLERLLTSIHAQGNAVRSKTHPDSRAIFYEDQVYSKRKIQNFIATLNGFRSSMEIIGVFQDDNLEITSKLLFQCVNTPDRDGGRFPKIEESLNFFYSAFDHETATKEGRIVPSAGVDPEYDNILEEVERVNDELQKYLEEQRKYFGCKVTYIGSDKKRFQLEVPEAAARKAGNDYELQSQRKGFKRFATSKSKDLLAQLIQAEERKKSVLQDLSRRVFEQFSSKYELWSEVIKCLSVLDVLLSLAVYAENAGGNLCIPKFELVENGHKPFVKIKDGRHPSIICAKGYVSNDTMIGCEDSNEISSSLIMVTGPNMGGKSTLMRQLGLLTIMAHIGCHIPADECVLTPVDRIFTRIGASDDIMAGESTFFVELSETSAILRKASKHSLVLVDELGRGTSTHDGTAIASATVKELVRLGCRTLFSTHYHSLVDDFKNSPDITMRHMACMVEEDSEDPTQETVTFLYKFEAGACPKSYGFNAARLGGIPSFITSRAYVKAKEIEQESHARKLFSSVCSSADLSSIIAQIKSL
ncbi:Probable DNA mismatch repair protein Msh6 [Gryllus bimaculatus]|nr:Probable DNA mismatch repair protein Msh6 [Gryllus bimaculatus]